MRIVLIGQAAFGEAVLKALQDAGEEIVGICAPATPAGGRPDPLRAAGEAAAIPVLPTRRLRRDEKVIQQYMDLKADLNVMAFVTDIIPERVLFSPPKGTIQYHPSLLPLHRGASAIAWAIIMGDTKTGLTIFWPDEGIDTGPILLQREVEIGPEDTVTTLYFNHLFPMGVEAIVESVRQVREGTAPKIDQDHSKATYESIIRDEHAAIDWQKDAHSVHNLIRGCNPQPGAYAMLNGEQLRIFDVEFQPGIQAAPGEIATVDDSGISVGLNGGGLLIKRVQAPGVAKTPASGFARERGITPGARLENGSPPTA